MCLGENGDSKVFKKFYIQIMKMNIEYEINIGEAVEQEEILCDEVEIVREFIYVGDRVSDGWRM